MKKRLTILLALTALAWVPAFAQDYETPEVKISQDKVRVRGKSYYAHVVTDKQTLYSISKAYNVSLQDIYEANRNLDLETSGLKTGQVIFIPTQPSAPAETMMEDPASAGVLQKETPPETSAEQPQTSSALDRWLFPGKYKKTPDADTSALGGITSILRDTSDFVLDIPEKITVSVILPFTNSQLADNTVDYYSGLLLAARDMGRNGVSIDIKTFDVRDSSSLNRDSFSGSDIIFGPITNKDMKVFLGKCPENKYIISPLDPQSAVLPKDFPAIQAPTPAALQHADIVKWAIQDCAPGDSIVLVTARDAAMSESSKCISDAIKSSGVSYSTISYGILQGLSIQKAFESHCSTHGTTRFIVAADEESFVNDVVRNVNLMAFKKHQVALYAPSRIRNFSMVETEYLHLVNTHISAAYFTDYTRNDVTSFVLAYRALFNAEPNQFAFHGYDTMHFFVNLCRVYGRQWPKVLEKYQEKGLQTDFRFVREDGSRGFTNTSVRRIVYTPDYRIVLQ
jgi:LysM repeat protein